jgi:hypothetical protein
LDIVCSSMTALAFDNCCDHVQEEAPKKVLLGRPGNNVKMGIVGLPNVGKCVFLLATPVACVFRGGLCLLMS